MDILQAARLVLLAYKLLVSYVREDGGRGRHRLTLWLMILELYVSKQAQLKLVCGCTFSSSALGNQLKALLMLN